MRKLVPRRPSPALVVACLALFVALGGTSLAVVNALPRNSVGAVQLRNNAVNSLKVKNRALLAVDFKAGQLPKGTRATKAIPGLRGRRVTQAPKGTRGIRETRARIPQPLRSCARLPDHRPAPPRRRWFPV